MRQEYNECLTQISLEEFLESEMVKARGTTVADPLAEASMMHHDILAAQSVAKDFEKVTILPNLGTLYRSQEYEGSSGERQHCLPIAGDQ